MNTLLFLVVGFAAAISSALGTPYNCDPNASCGCSVASSVVTSRIVGGEAAGNQTWNWAVSFQRWQRHYCGASLLTAEYAITAAHCIDDVKDIMSEVTIRVGSNYLDDVSSTTVQHRSVIAMTKHPAYNPLTLENDIGILKFAPLNVSTGSKIRFICLPEANRDPFAVNDSLVAIGWGTTEFSETAPVSNFLQQVTITAYASSWDDCQSYQPFNGTTQLCAGLPQGTKDTCQGDSGGPLMAFTNSRWVLAGITSYGDECAKPGRPGVYTRVSSYVPFINTQMGVETTTTTAATTMIVTIPRMTTPIVEPTDPVDNTSTITGPSTASTSTATPVGNVTGDPWNTNKTLTGRNQGNTMAKSILVSLLCPLLATATLFSFL